MLLRQCQDALKQHNDGQVTVSKALNYGSIIGEISSKQGREGETPEPKELYHENQSTKKEEASFKFLRLLPLHTFL